MTTIPEVIGLSAAALGAAAAVSAAGWQYGRWEARQHVLRTETLPLLPGLDELRILHLSDLHLTGRTGHREEWVRSLSQVPADLVVVTGDFLSSPEGIDRVPQALGALLERPGVYVYGSNDLFAAKPVNPLSYLRGPSSLRRTRRRPKIPLDHGRLSAALTEAGWQELNNTTAELAINGYRIAFAGTGDAHHRLDRYDLVADSWHPEADLRIGVTHAPYLRVLDAMSADGAEVIFAGHTHGGQVCVPGYGALVTNCDLEPARVKGLSRHGSSWLHVSAGLGTNPFVPVRVACRPEATLLTLTSRDTAQPGHGAAHAARGAAHQSS